MLNWRRIEQKKLQQRRSCLCVCSRVCLKLLSGCAAGYSTRRWRACEVTQSKHTFHDQQVQAGSAKCSNAHGASVSGDVYICFVAYGLYWCSCKLLAVLGSLYRVGTEELLSALSALKTWGVQWDSRAKRKWLQHELRSQVKKLNWLQIIEDTQGTQNIWHVSNVESVHHENNWDINNIRITW